MEHGCSGRPLYATEKDLIVAMGIVGCKEDKLRKDHQKMESPKLQDIIKLGEAFARKTFDEKGFVVKVKVVQSAAVARPKQNNQKK